LVVKIKKEVIDKCRQFEQSQKNIYMYGLPECTHPPSWLNQTWPYQAEHGNIKDGYN
jgi:hypothetical protein